VAPGRREAAITTPRLRRCGWRSRPDRRRPRRGRDRRQDVRRVSRPDECRRRRLRRRCSSRAD